MAKKALGVTARSGARRRLGLRADRHHHRAQPRRLLPRQQHELQAGRVREQRRGRSRPTRPAAATCYTTDQSGLYATRVKLANADDHVILPEVISKEPLGPAVRQGDDEWADVVKLDAASRMIQAEEFGVTAANVDQIKAETTNPDIQRFLGVIEGEVGKELGLPNDFAVQIIKQVGNYGESFDRNVGAEHAAEDRARPERAVDRRRPDVRAAVPLSRQRAGAPSARPPARRLTDEQPTAASREAEPPMRRRPAASDAPTRRASTTTRGSAALFYQLLVAGARRARRLDPGQQHAWPTWRGWASPAASASSTGRPASTSASR